MDTLHCFGMCSIDRSLMWKTRSSYIQTCMWWYSPQLPASSDNNVEANTNNLWNSLGVSRNDSEARTLRFFGAHAAIHMQQTECPVAHAYKSTQTQSHTSCDIERMTKKKRCPHSGCDIQIRRCAQFVWFGFVYAICSRMPSDACTL